MHKSDVSACGNARGNAHMEKGPNTYNISYMNKDKGGEALKSLWCFLPFFSPLQAYPMHKLVRGKVLIINVQKSRNGTDKRSK